MASRRATGEESRRAMRWFSALALLVALAVPGCTGIGPGTVGRDRLSYTGAVAESWKTQMLLNIVKLRYGDTPVFLDVGQIVSGYTVESTLSAVATANLYTWSVPHPNFPEASASLGAQGRFQDRPTVTYAPLAGERFARSMMTPLRPVSVLSLIQGGYPVDLVLRLVVNTINGVDNRFGGDARARAADPEFYTLLGALRRIQLSGTMGMRVHRTPDQEATLLTFRARRDPKVEADVAEVEKAKNPEASPLPGADPMMKAMRDVNMARKLYDMEMYADALKAAQNALLVAPVAHAYTVMGQAYAKLGKCAEAKRAFASAAKLDPREARLADSTKLACR